MPSSATEKAPGAPTGENGPEAPEQPSNRPAPGIPSLHPYARRLLERVGRRINTPYSGFFKNPQEKGKLHTATPYRLNTLEISEPRVSN